MTAQEQINTKATDFATTGTSPRMYTGYNHTRNFFIVIVLIEVVALLIASLI